MIFPRIFPVILLGDLVSLLDSKHQLIHIFFRQFAAGKQTGQFPYKRFGTFFATLPISLAGIQHKGIILR